MGGAERREDGEDVVVLYLDDDEDVLSLAERQLPRERPAITVRTAATIDAARRALDDRVDCVVADHRLPGGTGLEFLRSVREARPDLPLFLVTARGSEEVAGRAVSAGVTDYIRKQGSPEQFVDLADRIADAVAEYRAERAEGRADRRVRRVHERITDAVVALDTDWRYTYLNGRAEELLERDAAELLGRTIWDAFPALADTDFEGTLRTAMETQEPATVEDRFAPLDRWFEARVFPDDDGVTVYFRDVSDRKVRERELREERAFTESVFAALPDAFYAFDESGTFLRWNDRFEEVTGYSAEEIVEMRPLDFVPEADEDLIAESIDRVFDGERVTVESHFETKDGDVVPYEFTGAQLRDPDGEVLGLVGIGRDVSDRKERQRELERKNERLQEFAGVVSHDLRNPLTVASASVDLARETGEAEHLERAGSALDRMEHLVDDLLHLAARGEVVSDPQPVDLRPVVEQATDDLALAEVDAAVDCPDDVTVLADRGRLLELLENLVRNAVEHGEGVVRVEYADGTLAVADDGPGVPAGERDDVFDPGYTTADDGTGFGLSIVRTVAEAHGWDVSVTDGDRGGARFEVSGLEEH